MSATSQNLSAWAERHTQSTGGCSEPRSTHHVRYYLRNAFLCGNTRVWRTRPTFQPPSGDCTAASASPPTTPTPDSSLKRKREIRAIPRKNSAGIGRSRTIGSAGSGKRSPSLKGTNPSNLATDMYTLRVKKLCAAFIYFLSGARKIWNFCDCLDTDNFAAQCMRPYISWAFTPPLCDTMNSGRCIPRTRTDLRVLVPEPAAGAVTSTKKNRSS